MHCACFIAKNRDAHIDILVLKRFLNLLSPFFDHEYGLFAFVRPCGFEHTLRAVHHEFHGDRLTLRVGRCGHREVDLRFPFCVQLGRRLTGVDAAGALSSCRCHRHHAEQHHCCK